MRKIRDSSNTSCTAALSCFDDSRSVPNGFSMITRAVSLASPVEPSIRTTAANADGGTARWNSRPMCACPLPVPPLPARRR